MSLQNDAHSDRQGPDFQGRLDVLSLFDVCQFLMINRKTGILRIDEPPDIYTLSFLEGQIQDVTGPSFQAGVKALHKALRLRSGRFEFRTKSIPPLGAFDESTDSLLLEAARQMDEMGEGIPEAELQSRQQRLRDLARLLEQVTRPSQLEGKGQDVEGWIQRLDSLGTRLHTDESGQSWLESPDGRTLTRGVDPRFRDKLLECILGPKRDRLLEGSQGLLESPRGEIWWTRSGQGPKLLTLGKVREAYPSLSSLGIELGGIEAAITVVEARTRMDVAVLVGALFQDPAAFGDGSGALLSPWPLARPVGRLGPTLWIPGATPESLSDLESSHLGLSATTLAVDSALNPAPRALAAFVNMGWRVLLGVSRTGEKTNQSMLPSGSLLLKFEPDPVNPGRFTVATSREAA